MSVKGYDSNGFAILDEPKQTPDEYLNTQNTTDTSSWSDALPVIGSVVKGFDTLNDIAYNLEDPLSNDPIYDAALRGTAQDRHVANQIYGMVAGIIPGMKTSYDREFEAAQKHARNDWTDFSNMRNIGNLKNINTNSALQDTLSASSDPRAYYTANVLNKDIMQGNINTLNSIEEARSATMANQKQQALRNYLAEGGELNGVIHINEGGSHESNPNEGVQMGIAPDSLPNLVEEGEIVFDNYVYSNRLKPSKKLLEDNLLPEKYVGLTFAEIADKLQKESEDRPNDPISIQTLKDWMSRLQNAQETHKMRLEDNRINKTLGELDLSQDMFAKGGKIYIKPENRGKFTALKKRTGKSASWFKAHGTPAQKKMATFALNARKWKHEDGGHLFPEGGYPFGALGAGLDYYITSGDYNRDLIRDAIIRNSPSTLSKISNLKPIEIVADKVTNPTQTQIIIPDLGEDYYQPKYMPDMITTEAPLNVEGIKDLEEPDYKKLKKDIRRATRGNNTSVSLNAEDLRYAPAIGAWIAALQASLQPRDYSYANRLEQLAGRYNPVSAPAIGGYRAYTPYDVNLGDAENLAIQAAALRANRGQNRATQAALNTAILDKMSKANSERNLAAQQANEANRLAVDTYNRGIDERNAALTQAYDQLNQQINNNRINMLARAAAARDASDEAWASMINATSENLFNQLGNVGRDSWNQNQAVLRLKALGFSNEEINKLLGR